MKICMVPDANIKAVRNSLENLVVGCGPGSKLPCGASLYHLVISSFKTVDSILDQTPTPNGPPSIQKWRANRISLEQVHENIQKVATAKDKSQDQEFYGYFEVRTMTSLDNMKWFDIQLVLEHLGQDSLNLWEVEDEA